MSGFYLILVLLYRLLEGIGCSKDTLIYILSHTFKVAPERTKM